MGNVVLKILVIIIILVFGGEVLFGIGSFLYMVLRAPIEALFDATKDKSKQKVLGTSELIKRIKELNNSFSYKQIDSDYQFRKECKSKQEFNRTLPKDYLHYVLKKEKTLISKLEKDIQYNQAVIGEYNKQCEKLQSNYSFDSSLKESFRKAELEIFEKEKLKIRTTYSFTILVSYVTPQRRKRYSKSKTFSRAELLSEIKKIDENRIAKEQRIAQMEYERSQMTSKLRYEVLKRDHYRCVICGASSSDGVTKLHVDHIIPIARGGKTELSNLQTLCQRCNLGKGTSD